MRYRGGIRHYHILADSVQIIMATRLLKLIYTYLHTTSTIVLTVVIKQKILFFRRHVMTLAESTVIQ